MKIKKVPEGREDQSVVHVPVKITAELGHLGFDPSACDHEKENHGNATWQGGRGRHEIAGAGRGDTPLHSWRRRDGG